LDPVKNGVVSQRAYDRPLDDVKRRVALDILAEVRRTIREQSGDYVRLKVFYPTADKGKKSANEIFVIGLELGAVEISVSDTGIGISPEDQAKIFEEFRQVGGDYAHKREGTGLGLTLAKKFVELHGGVKSGWRVRWARVLPSALPYLRDYRPADSDRGG
jgi:signal transduction histidine kinase